MLHYAGASNSQFQVKKSPIWDVNFTLTEKPVFSVFLLLPRENFFKKF
jgi:hypothetical protein